jgi:hypothetical protein
LIILVAVVCCAGLVLAAKPGGGGGCPQPRPNCVCPAIYDPVVCDGGCTYSNSCRASCAGARNCTGGGGVIEVAAAFEETVTKADSPACEANSTPAVATVGTVSFEDSATQAAAGGTHCKACKDRPFCHCSYNGLPRVSCNPCCYGNLGIPQVCLD